MLRTTKTLRLGAFGLCLLLGYGVTPCHFGVIPEAAVAQERVADPLPSWNDGPVKRTILKFVEEVTDRDNPKYVPPEDRIATFDNDGTLWAEMPIVELAFTRARIKAMAAKDPAIADKQPFKAALEDDREYFREAGMKALMELVVATHGDMPQDQFDEEARAFFEAAEHPAFAVRYPRTAYRPMVELLQHLRAHGFQTWICSGGWADLMRSMSREAYGIPPQQVIGSSLKKKLVEKELRLQFGERPGRKEPREAQGAAGAFPEGSGREPCLAHR